ncbi:MAG: ABC transporter permease [Candidatus Zixiibacteriota bacterium]
MTLRDLFAISTGNLWRMKLRSFLTVSGVVIAIAAFVSMLSFGAGNQQLVTRQFNELGLFTTMQVYPAESDDSAAAKALNHETLDILARLPGVNLVYPYYSFTVEARLPDTVLSTEAQALPTAAFDTKLFSQLRSGRFFAGDSSREVVVNEEFLEEVGLEKPDSIVGQKIILSVSVASLDSGIVSVIEQEKPRLKPFFKQFRYDSLSHQHYREKVFYSELNQAVKFFLDGFMNHRTRISDTLTICGILKKVQSHRLNIKPIILPAQTARQFNASGFGDDPSDLFSALQSGTFFAPRGIDTVTDNYSQVTLDLDPTVPYEIVSDTIEALGYRVFSFAARFKEISRFFLYFDLALGLIGLIALITASLGIINTMVMSIIERKREIGMLKSLGADEGDIKVLFLVESSVIGMIGAAGGIVFGWLITRLASFIARTIMIREGIDETELFALPWWLILIAFLFGLIVSLIAGLYPASRAARVDPVEALRNE